MDIIKEISKELLPTVELPKFKSGDNITVYYRIKEGNKERIQFFKGDVFDVPFELMELYIYIVLFLDGIIITNSLSKQT